MRAGGEAVNQRNRAGRVAEVEQNGLRTQPEGETGAGAGVREAKYQRILAAAVEVIAENGFANSRVAEIAARAGVADGTIYLYFKNKDQILMAALDDAFVSFLAAARERLQHLEGADEQLKAIIHLHLEALAANRPLAVVLQTELRQSAKFLAEFSQRQLRSYLELIRDVVREGQSRGTFRKSFSEGLAVSVLFGAMDDVVTAWVLSERSYDLSAMAEGIYDVIVHGISGERA